MLVSPVMKNLFLSILLLVVSAPVFADEKPINVSGVYPHLRMWNHEGECGTGAVVLWQGELWVVTYAPHAPTGSSDKLYQITTELEKKIYEGSVGGTPANRMIHKESDQLLIGPYVIDAEKNIRVLTSDNILGRLTANARHLTDPANKVYYATMEEGLYEVDMKTLDVKCFIRDGHAKGGEGVKSELPGYHGKGLYSTQDRLVYANNGDRGPKVTVDPTVESGALAEWFGEGDWQLVRRNQFTEVTGPGGIQGNENPETDPIWAMGWDARSVILALLENKEWHYYRLPKGSHSYDGAHGWNTEWPRIREIGDGKFLATMHGTFWDFPGNFSLASSGGIAPRSNYLKVIGDFCRWDDKIVFGCDDSAKAEFLNTRPFKAERGAPGQSNSNLWFVAPDQLGEFGPSIGRGSVWLRDDLKAGEPSDPYLFSGYDHRQLHLVHGEDTPVTFAIEVDLDGNNTWESLRKITVPNGKAVSEIFAPDEAGAWVRIKAETDANGVTANFQYRSRDKRESGNADLFAGVASAESPAVTTGVMRSLSYDRLGLVAKGKDGASRYYEVNEKLELIQQDNVKAARELVKAVRQPESSYSVDAASVVLIEDGKRYRIPKNESYVESSGASAAEPEGDTLAKMLKKSHSLGAKVAVSSTHESYSADNVGDGLIEVETDRWISKNEKDPWIELDFGSEKSVKSVWLISGWNLDSKYSARDFDVQIPEGDSWKTISGGEVRGNHDVNAEIVLEEAVSTSKIRVVMRGIGYFRVYELAAFDEVLEVDPVNIANIGEARVCREVATERDLLNVHGTFYELPARNAQGVAKMRPVATHNLKVQDFCSHNGLLFFTGIDGESENDHIFRSADGNAAVWAGVIDDLWKLGKPRGKGGPWKDSAVKANVPSDPYLMTAYDRKTVSITTDATAKVTLEVDVDGTGLWLPYQSFSVEAGKELNHEFPEGFSAYWVRSVSDADANASVIFTYE